MTPATPPRRPLDWFLKALGGSLIIAIGLLTLYVGSGYAFGTTRAMGPGYFPVVLGSVLTLIGLTILVTDLMAARHAVLPFDLRAAFSILAAMLAFAALIRPLGLAVTIMIVVAIASAAERDFKPLRVLAIGVSLVVITATVFVYLLRLQIKVLPW